MTLRKLGVALLGVLLVGLAGLALSKVRRLIYLHNEGETNGNLRAIRSALSIYRDDRHGQYPPDLAALMEGGIYLTNIPVAKYSSHHGDSSAVHLGTRANDAGGWLYDNVKGDANFGSVRVNCTHADSRGRAWTSY